MASTTYRIFSENLAPLHKLIAKMNKRCVRLGLAPINAVVESVEKIENEDGFIESWTTVAIAGETPKLNGFTFKATLQHAGEAGNILRTMPGVDALPEKFRSADPGNCDHCKKYRRRNDTYIVQHEDGTYFQVGSTCLQDFVRSDKVGSYAAMCEMMSMIHEASERFGENHGERAESSVLLDVLLAYSAEAMFRNGWVSRTKAREYDKDATVDIALRAMDSKQNRCTKYCKVPCPSHFTPTAAARELAEKVLAWAPEWLEREMKRDQDSDYIWNMHVVLASEVCTLRAAGLAASVLSAYQREMEYNAIKKVNAASSTSVHIGTIGQRFVVPLTIQAFRYIHSDSYGVSTLITYHDDDDNVVKWFASGEHKVEVGTRAILEVGITKHVEFAGVKETHVNRVKIYQDKATKAATAKARKLAKAAYEALQSESSDLWSSLPNRSHDSFASVYAAYESARHAANVAHAEWQNIK